MNTQERADALIELLSDKKLYWDEFGKPGDNEPVLIGDVLQKMDDLYPLVDLDEDYHHPNAISLLKLWERCGFTASLNRIFEKDIPSDDTYSTGIDGASLLGFLWGVFGEAITKQKND